MPADDDYGRRQSTLQQQQQQTSPASTSSSQPLHCPVGCLNNVSNSTDLRYASNEGLLTVDSSTTGSHDRYEDRFVAERSSSDRLPSGERYQGISERYPLGEKPTTSISSERLIQTPTPQQERYQYSSQRYPERYTPTQNIGSLERFHAQNTFDKYSRTNSPTDRYLTLGTQKERCNTVSDRYSNLEDRHSSVQNISVERYTPTERYKNASKSDMYKIRDRSSSSDRKSVERYQQFQSRFSHEQFGTEPRYPTERFPPIPCPERFATQERNDRSEKIPFGQMSYMEPPSPAPASDRFIPPPPLSPDSTPSPDCFPNNTFPSPTTTVQPTERFIPPPPLSPSPTENYSPKKQRYHEHFSSLPATSDGSRYHQDQRFIDRNQYCQSSDRYQGNNSNHQPSYHHTEKYVNSQDRYNSNGRYVPTNPHMPVDRYIPQETYYGNYHSYERFSKLNNSSDPYMRRDLNFHYRLPIPYAGNQHQRARYIGTPSRVKCCQYQDSYHYPKSSPGSSSSSSVTSSQGKEIHQKDVPACVVNASLQEMQCQNYQTKEYQCSYQQEKGTQCGNVQCQQQNSVTGKECVGFVRTIKAQCRHSICSSPSVEYVGASGGRHVCATPPPRSNVCSGDASLCNEICCARRSQTTVAIWKTPLQPQQQQQTPPQQHTPGHQHSTRSNTPISPALPQDTLPQPHQLQQQQQPQQIIQQQQIQQPTQEQQQHNQQQQQRQVQQQQQQQTQQQTQQSQPLHQIQIQPQQQQQQQHYIPQRQQNEASSETKSTDILPVKEMVKQQTTTPPTRTPLVRRAVSMPVSSPDRSFRSQPPRSVNYSQSDNRNQRPHLERSTSRKEMIKNYIKKETATFFGVDEESEAEQQLRWLDRRKRMASRAYGPLKDEYRTPSFRSHRRAYSEIPSRYAVSGQLQTERPDVLPGSSDVPDASQDQLVDASVRRKDSVARLTWDGLSYIVTTLTRHRPRPRSQQVQWSRSFAADTPTPASAEEQSFFEKPSAAPDAQLEAGDVVDRGETVQLRVPYRERYTSQLGSGGPGPGGWRRDPKVVREGQNRPAVGSTRIYSNVLDNVVDNSNRRQHGMSWLGRVFNHSFRSSVMQDEKVQDMINQQLDDIEDHRPMFTYWVTTVQILVLFISLVCYGFGPFGVDLQSRSGQVLVTSLSLQQVDYTEPANFWFGPRASDLIHLGAKFAPCMRIDDKIAQEIDKIRAKERETACCIRNDDSGCVQSSKTDCSQTISTWKKWKDGDSGPGGRISGSVCGLDPKFCDAPASVHPYEWPDDITKWPICRKKTQLSAPKRSRDKQAEHMVCEIIGHPCCIGIHGHCKITTKEYCDFVKGAFHEEASLCSQVSCLNDVCGMLPFYFPETPDQFYRLWTSLFLHAGILQLAITVLIQYFLMRDLEKLTGSLRIGIIYLGSGVAGNLASAIFVPYRADVGPAGSQFGLLACLIVEVLNSWPMLKQPNQALCKLLSITFVLFVIGLFPWVDNYAHLFGFVFGFLLSYALLPFISLGHYDRRKKIVLIWICLLSAGFLFICLVLLFYIIPVYDCKICSYFNCIPFTREFCASQNVNFKREEV